MNHKHSGFETDSSPDQLRYWLKDNNE